MWKYVIYYYLCRNLVLGDDFVFNIVRWFGFSSLRFDGLELVGEFLRSCV